MADLCDHAPAASPTNVEQERDDHAGSDAAPLVPVLDQNAQLPVAGRGPHRTGKGHDAMSGAIGDHGEMTIASGDGVGEVTARHRG